MALFVSCPLVLLGTASQDRLPFPSPFLTRLCLGELCPLESKLKCGAVPGRVKGGSGPDKGPVLGRLSLSQPNHFHPSEANVFPEKSQGLVCVN